jgi:hypothetical protein
MMESKEDTIQRLLNSRDYLWKHVISFGCITNCHTKLFQRIDEQLEREGVNLDEVYP